MTRLEKEKRLLLSKLHGIKSKCSGLFPISPWFLWLCYLYIHIIHLLEEKHYSYLVRVFKFKVFCRIAMPKALNRTPIFYTASRTILNLIENCIRFNIFILTSYKNRSLYLQHYRWHPNGSDRKARDWNSGEDCLQGMHVFGWSCSAGVLSSVVG